MKIVYVGVDYYANCLEMLLKNESIEVLKVFTCQDSKKHISNPAIMKLAKAHSIPVRTERISEKDLRELFENRYCDYLICACYQ